MLGIEIANDKFNKIVPNRRFNFEIVRDINSNSFWYQLPLGERYLEQINLAKFFGKVLGLPWFQVKVSGILYIISEIYADGAMY